MTLKIRNGKKGREREGRERERRERQSFVVSVGMFGVLVLDETKLGKNLDFPPPKSDFSFPLPSVMDEHGSDNHITHCFQSQSSLPRCLALLPSLLLLLLLLLLLWGNTEEPIHTAFLFCC